MAFSVPSPSLTSESSKESNNMKARYACEAPGCTQFFFHKPSKSKILCAIHEVEDRFNKSKAKLMASKTPSAPKPFRKAKLYPVKPDEGMKPLKRKRASTGKRGTTSNDHDLDSMETGLEKPQQLEVTNPLASGPQVGNMTLIRTPREIARNFAFPTSMGSNKSPNEGDIARSLGPGSMAESPIEPTPIERANMDWEAKNVL